MFRRGETDRRPAEGAHRRLWVGLAVALLVVLLVLAFRSLPVSARFYRAIELKTLDLRFRLRADLPEDPRIVNVDIDDRSLRNLRLNFPLSRTEYGRIIGTLRRLGASRIVVDVLFHDATAWSAELQEGGRIDVSAHDVNLAAAIAAAGNVHLAWSYSRDRLPADGPPDLPDRLRPIVTGDLTLGAAEAARRAGAPASLLADSFEALRGRLLKEHLVDALRGRPADAGPAAPEEILRSAVPKYDADRHAEEARRVREALAEAESIVALDRHSAWPWREAPGRSGDPMREIFPPWRALVAGPGAGGAAGAGYVNVDKDDDGVLRRIRPMNVWRGRAYPHLAFRVACEVLGVPPDGIRAGPRRRLDLARPAPPEPAGRAGALRVPLTDSGDLLINWVGGRPDRPPFAHVPVGSLLVLDRASRDVGINTLVAFDKVRGVAAFLADRFPAALPARETAVPPALGALMEAEAKAADAPRGDAWARMERHAALRGHADWMLDRIRFWREKAGPLLDAAGAQKRIAAEAAAAARAALEEASGIVRDFVLPYRAREEEIVRAFGGRIRGAICILGAGGSGHDTHATPLDTTVPGPWVIAHLVNMFLTDRFLREAPAAADVAAILLCGLLIALIVSSAGPIASTAAVLAGEAAWIGAAQAAFVFRGVVVDVTGPALVLFLTYAFITAYRQLVEGRDRRRIQRIFGLFVNEHVLAELKRDPRAIALGGQKRVVTVFFSDVAGFTALSERLDPADQVRFMNTYLTAMSNRIMACGGCINKYIGDGILALFGAPLPSATHAADAARAASACLDALHDLNARLAAEGKPALRIRIGISSGEAVVGLVGALGKKLEYTAMGDVVNLGARLEAASKTYRTTVLMSEASAALCGDRIVAREVDLVRVPGKSIPVRVYELMGVKAGGGAAPDDGGFLAAYESALAHYRGRRWAEAEAGFRRCLSVRPEDGPSALLAARCARFRAEPPREDWDGVAEVTVK